jgi:UDP-N-acetylmuramate: L-alanyl-gamma-D-glutamyl-meso-diaminopimelate ligase
VDELARTLQAGDHVLVMSNGGFGGIHEKLLARLARRPASTPATREEP